MSDKNGLWELFRNTGLPEAYMAYREQTVRTQRETEKNGEQI